MTKQFAPHGNYQVAMNGSILFYRLHGLFNSEGVDKSHRDNQRLLAEYPGSRFALLILRA